MCRGRVLNVTNMEDTAIISIEFLNNGKNNKMKTV